MEVDDMKRWEHFSLEEIREFTKNSNSIHELAIKMGYSPNSGSGAASIKKMIEQLKLDTSHFTGQVWNKDKIDLSKFKTGCLPPKTALKNLIALRGHKCEKCHLELWDSQLIPLQVHHIDGARYNNQLNNLQLLCPNCHALTDNFGIKNYNTNKPYISDEKFIEVLKQSTSIFNALVTLGMNTSGTNYRRAYKLKEENNIQFIVSNKASTSTSIKQNKCYDCGKPISSNAFRCIECDHKRQQKVTHPSREELKYLIKNLPFTTIGKQFGVSDNAIRKWCITEKLPYKSSEIKLYTDEEWENL